MRRRIYHTSVVNKGGIPIITSNRSADRHLRRPSSFHTAASLPRHQRFLQPVRRSSSALSLSTLKVGVFNARSVANKSDSIANWIYDEGIMLAAVVETWHEGHDSPGLIGCAPVGYSYVERARPRHNTSTLATNHGGVCLIHHRQLHVRRVHLPDYSTFEYVCAMVSRSAMQTIAVVIYRPGSMAVSDNFSINSLTYWNVSLTTPLCC